MYENAGFFEDSNRNAVIRNDSVEKHGSPNDEYYDPDGGTAFEGVVDEETEADDEAEMNAKRVIAFCNGFVTTKVVAAVLTVIGVNVSYNLATRKMEISGMPEIFSKTEAPNTLPVLICDYLAEKGVKTSLTTVVQRLHTMEDLNRFNPIVEMLERTACDGVDRIGIIIDILGLSDNNPESIEIAERKARYRLYVTKWLHQCVAMALNDEDNPYSADGVLVLQGAQGIGKTLFFRKIAVESLWFGEGISVNMKKKDDLIKATGKWIAEIGELDDTLALKQSSLKSFLTFERDEIRSPWARVAVNKPRRTSFCGTVNPDRFLTDETGSRRFWVVKIKHIDLDALLKLDKDWMHQLWAQVYQELYLQNPQGFRLTKEEEAQLQKDNMEFLVPITGEMEILEKLCWDIPVEEWSYITMSELVKFVGGMNSGQAGKAVKRLQKRDPRIKEKKVHNNIRKYLLPLPMYGEDQTTGGFSVVKPFVS